MTVTLRFQSTGMVPGAGAPATLHGGSLTIGRGQDNDLVLPDPDRTISKQHCVIEDQNGKIVVIDLSTNGTFLNYGKVPLGRTPTPLNDGDVLCLGGYELLVSLGAQAEDGPATDPLPPMNEAGVSHGQAAQAQDPIGLLDDPGGDGDFLDDLLGGSDAPSGPGRVRRDELGDDGLLPPLGEDEPLPGAGEPPDIAGPTPASHNPAQEDHVSFGAARVDTAPRIPEDWDEDFLKDIVPPEDVHDASPASAPPRPEQTVSPVRPAPPPPETGGQEAAETPRVPPDHEPGTAPRGDAARAFLEAAGVADLDVRDDELVSTMARMGGVMRQMIEGLREILMTRTSIKSEFRIEQTMIGAGGNNPLKFSISPEQAMQAMVKPTTRGYLDPDEATQEALRDIKAHEVAVISGMEAALKGVLQKLSPENLSGKIETSGGLGGLLKGRKARYWEVYEKMYAEISDQAAEDFHELFSKEFARAYQEQLEKLK